jgi:hypothetical protein
VQDLIHLGVICVVLYYAPNIQDRIQQRRNAEQERETDQIDPDHHDLEPIAIGGHDPANHDHPTAPPIHPDVAADELDAIPPAAAAANVEPGPADPPRPPPNQQQQQRNVGAKKAKSLAKKDQRRAYHEFQRSQGDAQRARDAEGAAEREAAQTAERERRRLAEAALEAKKAREREQRRVEVQRAREAQMVVRERVVDEVRAALDARGWCHLVDVVDAVGAGDEDEVWAEKILRAGGVLGTGADGSLTVVTSTGWAVRVRRGDMLAAYAKAAECGRGEMGEVTLEDLGMVLEDVIRYGTGWN